MKNMNLKYLRSTNMKTFIITIALFLSICSTASASTKDEAIILFTMCDKPVYIIYATKDKGMQLIPVDSRNPNHIAGVTNIILDAPIEIITVIKLNKQLWDISGIRCHGEKV